MWKGGLGTMTEELYTQPEKTATVGTDLAQTSQQLEALQG